RMFGLLFKTEAHVEFLSSKRMVCQPRAEIAQHAPQKEQERLQQLYRVLQFHGLFEAQRFLERLERAFAFSSCQLAQPDAFGSETCGDTGFRQRGQVAEPSYAPTLQRFG